jgi:acyl carrier protein
MVYPPDSSTDAQSVLDHVRSLLAELLHLESVDSVAPDATLREDLGVDSLGMVDLVTLLEEAFSIRFATNTDLSEIQNVADVAALVEERIAAKSA